MMPYPRVPLLDKTALRNHPLQKAMPLDLARDDFGMAGMAGMAGVPLKSTAAASVALDSMYTAHPAGRTALGESLTSADTSADYGASVAGAGAGAGAAGAGAAGAASGAGAAPGHAPPGSSAASAASSFASSSFAATTPQLVFAPPPPLMLLPAFSSPPKAPLFIDPATTKPREKRRKKTKKELKEEAFDLSLEEKPPYLYATLIGILILSHHDKKLTLSQIYAWISHTFKYYKREDVGWQNLIRHNLLLNKAFVKGDKLKDGKGHFWCIKPGCEDQFLKLKLVRKLSYHEVMDQLHRRAPLPTSPPPEPPAKRARLGAPFADWDDMAPAPGASAPADPAPRPGADDAPRPGAAATTAAAAAPDPEGAYPTFALGLALLPERLAYPLAFALELSPARPAATGPILEPLTPGLLRMKAPPLLKPPANPLPHLLPRGHLLPRPLPRAAATPHQATPQTKTPLRALRTPQTHGRRLWNLPLYLEEFYLPLVHLNHRAVFNSYDDDELVLRPWPSPGRRRATQLSPVTSRNLMGDLRRAESGGGSPGRRGSRSGTATDADE